ncbi:hypothetical protein, partial [Streptomyces sp. IBSBF 2390]|uniref:hypothetical protein n=1 Tax=Streptomyces sp. IBSBF 2390 TaxID=2903533 RepID=UPI002FDC14D2
RAKIVARRPLTLRKAVDAKKAVRMVLVDTSSDDGIVDENIRNRVELHVLTEIPKRENKAELYCEAGWMKGHRTFLKEAVSSLRLNDQKVQVIPYEELHTVRKPRGWVWVPKPFITSELLLELVQSLNPDYNTGNWAVVPKGL